MVGEWESGRSDMALGIVNEKNMRKKKARELREEKDGEI